MINGTINEIIGCIIIVVLYILRRKEIGVFKSDKILLLMWGIAGVIMNDFIGIFLAGVVVISFIIIGISRLYNIKSIKEYIKDKTILGYYVSFKLINGDIYYLTVEPDEFSKIKFWYDGFDNLDNKIYKIREENRDINLNREHVVEFSFEKITNITKLFAKANYYVNYHHL